MVLADDNFASIVAAVREGRTVYDNLTKVIGWTLPTNGGEALIIVLAILFGLTLPITPVQILWINMVTGGRPGAGAGLRAGGAGHHAASAARRRRKRCCRGSCCGAVVFVSVLFAVGAFGMFAWAKQRGLDRRDGAHHGRQHVVVMRSSICSPSAICTPPR